MQDNLLVASTQTSFSGATVWSLITIFICETAGCKCGAPKQDFQVFAAGVDRLMFQWTFLSNSCPQTIYIHNTRACWHAFDTVALAVEYVWKELCVWLWYFFIGPTDTCIQYTCTCRLYESTFIYDIVWSIHLSIFLFFHLSIFLSLSMYRHTYISIHACIRYVKCRKWWSVSHEKLDCFVFRRPMHTDM